MPPFQMRELLAPVDLFIPEKRRFYQSGDKVGQPREKQFFVYSAIFTGATVLAAGATVVIGIQIDADADLLIMAIQRIATLTDNVTFISRLPANLLLTTTGGGSRMYDQALHVETQGGDGQLPGILPWPIWIPGSGVLQVALTNLDPVNAFNVTIDFPGIKIY